MIGVETLTGILEIVVTAAILFVIWKFIDKMDPDIGKTGTKR